MHTYGIRLRYAVQSTDELGTDAVPVGAIPCRRLIRESTSRFKISSSALTTRSSATCANHNVGAFVAARQEASLKQPLTPYAAPLRPREPRAAGPTCQQKTCEVQRSENKHSRLPYLAQNVGRSCATLLNGHCGGPPRTALLPDGLSPIVWFVFCVPGKAFQPARRVAWGQPISQLQSGSSSGIVPTGRYNTNLIPNYSR